jgi:hypothetical protein
VDHPDAWEQFKRDVAAKMNPEYTIGWNHDSNGWWYAVTNWQVLPHPETGEMCDFYFEPRAGHDLECALYKTDSNGVQEPAKF